MRDDTLITVEWNGGTERGFMSKEDAERFILHVCKKTAPNLNYSIYSIYKSRI